VYQLTPTTEAQMTTSLGFPDGEDMVSEQEEEAEGEEMQLLSSHPAWKEAFKTLAVLDAVIIASNADDKILRAMDDIQDFVSKIYKQSLKQSLIDISSVVFLGSFCLLGCSFYHCIYVLDELYLSGSFNKKLF
jgi:hypothetical protein